MIMLKRLIVFFLITVVFAGCSRSKSPVKENETLIADTLQYWIVKDSEGNTVLRFKDMPATEKSSGSTSAYEIVVYPQFSSVAAMQEGILTGNLGEYGDNAIKDMKESALRRGNGQEMVIVGLDDMLDVSLPEDSCLDYVTWYGDSYDFHFCSPENHTDLYGGIYQIFEQETFDKCAAEYAPEDLLSDIENSHGRMELLSDNVIEDRNARVISYKLNGYQTNVFYTLTSGNKTVHVFERYHGNYDYPGAFTGGKHDPVPYEIVLHAQDDKFYLEVLIHLPTSRPSVEWLSSFGLKPYVEK